MHSTTLADCLLQPSPQDLNKCTGCACRGYVGLWCLHVWAVSARLCICCAGAVAVVTALLVAGSCTACGLCDWRLVFTASGCRRGGYQLGAPVSWSVQLVAIDTIGHAWCDVVPSCCCCWWLSLLCATCILLACCASCTTMARCAARGACSQVVDVDMCLCTECMCMLQPVCFMCIL